MVHTKKFHKINVKKVSLLFNIYFQVQSTSTTFCFIDDTFLYFHNCLSWGPCINFDRGIAWPTSEHNGRFGKKQYYRLIIFRKFLLSSLLWKKFDRFVCAKISCILRRPENWMQSQSKFCSQVISKYRGRFLHIFVTLLQNLNFTD